MHSKENLLKRLIRKIRLKERLKNIYISITFNENVDPFENDILKTKSYWINSKQWHDEDQASNQIISNQYYLDKYNLIYENIIGREIQEFVKDKAFYVLEIGCSKGQFLFYLDQQLTKRFRPAKSYFGIEINQETCNEALERSNQLGNDSFTFSSSKTPGEIIDSLSIDEDMILLVFTIRTLAHFIDSEYYEFVESMKKINKGLIISSENAYTSKRLLKNFNDSNVNVFINRKRLHGHRLSIIQIDKSHN